ncbi:MAG: hypothetical protein LBI02_09610 [Opitutaceae bacterium]|nr:hypothetical protein [Opitutaceae bacterium]
MRPAQTPGTAPYRIHFRHRHVFSSALSYLSHTALATPTPPHQFHHATTPPIPRHTTSLIPHHHHVTHTTPPRHATHITTPPAPPARKPIF